MLVMAFATAWQFTSTVEPMPGCNQHLNLHAGGDDDLEEAAVEAMRTGLQCSHLAADTVFAQIRALTGCSRRCPCHSLHSATVTVLQNRPNLPSCPSGVPIMG